MSPGLLAEKVLMVTGAGRSLGAIIAEACVGEGATVIATDITGDEDGAVVRHDVTRADDWTRIIDDAVSAHGRLDGLVNNAAVILEARPFLEESPEEFARLLDVNVMGVWLGMQAAGRAMSGTGGSIVNISSTAGMTGYAYHGAYGHTKWALRGLTKVAAVEFGEAGIRVNSVHPGPIKTGMLPGFQDPEVDERFNRIPARRAGEPSEVASLVLFLASDESAFISGVEHVIDGGSTTGPAIPYEWDPAVHGPKGS
jgi:3alpha(or 20beta)-hydroxysteroid dehydrogenase